VTKLTAVVGQSIGGIYRFLITHGLTNKSNVIGLIVSTGYKTYAQAKKRSKGHIDNAFVHDST